MQATHFLVKGQSSLYILFNFLTKVIFEMLMIRFQRADLQLRISQVYLKALKISLHFGLLERKAVCHCLLLLRDQVLDFLRLYLELLTHGFCLVLSLTNGLSHLTLDFLIQLFDLSIKVYF